MKYHSRERQKMIPLFSICSPGVFSSVPLPEQLSPPLAIKRYKAAANNGAFAMSYREHHQWGAVDHIYHNARPRYMQRIIVMRCLPDTMYLRVLGRYRAGFLLQIVNDSEYTLNCKRYWRTRGFVRSAFLFQAHLLCVAIITNMTRKEYGIQLFNKTCFHLLMGQLADRQQYWKEYTLQWPLPCFNNYNFTTGQCREKYIDCGKSLQRCFMRDGETWPKQSHISNPNLRCWYAKRKYRKRYSPYGRHFCSCSYGDMRRVKTSAVRCQKRARRW